MCLQASQFKVWGLNEKPQGLVLFNWSQEREARENTFPRACSSGSHCKTWTLLFLQGGMEGQCKCVLMLLPLGTDGAHLLGYVSFQSRTTLVEKDSCEPLAAGT